MDAEKKLSESIGVALEIKQVAVGSYNINYVTAGQGEALLLIHGANIGWGQWYKNIATLSQHFTVYAIDLPGAGSSTKIDFRKSDLTKDFVDVVDGFVVAQNLERVSMIGHSFAGWITLKLALRQRKYLHKIVLVDSMGFTSYTPLKQRLATFYPIVQLLIKVAVPATKEGLENFSKDVMDKHTSAKLSHEFIEYLYEAVNREKLTHPLQLIHRLLSFGHLRKELVLIDELPRIKKRTLVIFGDNDPLIPLEKVREKLTLISNAQVKIFPETGHLPFIEKSDEFNKIVIDFLLAR